VTLTFKYLAHLRFSTLITLMMGANSTSIGNRPVYDFHDFEHIKITKSTKAENSPTVLTSQRLTNYSKLYQFWKADD